MISGKAALRGRGRLAGFLAQSILRATTGLLARALGMLAASCLATTAVAVEASIDRDTIFEGEGVVFTISTDRRPGAAEPDFSPLQQDFYLGDTSQRQRLDLINGRQQISVQWSIVLEPRSTGEMVIPSISVGDEQTRPLQLTVLPRGTEAEGADLFLEMTIDPAAPYVHAQALLVIKLYHVDALTEARLVEPDLPDAVVERVSEDLTYPAVIGGTRYRVLERRFAVFPERSGTMEIPAAAFRGRVADAGGRFNSIFDRGRRVSVRSQPLTLDVRPRPAAYPEDAPWLPAAKLTLQERWPDGEPQFRVGEPVTRVIVLEADGLLSAQMPEIAVPDMPELKVYPDQPQSQTRTDGTRVFGRREQSYALVPTRAGELALPEIAVSWWDTEAEALQTARIPARTVSVAPAPGSTTGTDASDASPGTTDVQRQDPFPQPWPWIALLAVGLWLITLIAWWRERRPRRTPRPSARNDQASPRRAWRQQLKKACGDNDASAAATALLGWASVEGRRYPNLGALAARAADPELAEEVRRLDRVLYAGDPAQWQGDRLWALLRRDLKLRPDQEPQQADGLLPPLYPEER